MPFMSCTDGSIRVLVPVQLKDEEVNFIDFQDCMSQEIPFLGGFNTRDSRKLSQRHRTYKVTSRGNIVDGDLINDFLSLSTVLKNHIYEKSDITREDLKDQLLKMI